MILWDFEMDFVKFLAVGDTISYTSCRNPFKNPFKIVQKLIFHLSSFKFNSSFMWSI